MTPHCNIRTWGLTRPFLRGDCSENETSGGHWWSNFGPNKAQQDTDQQDTTKSKPRCSAESKFFEENLS